MTPDAPEPMPPEVAPRVRAGAARGGGERARSIQADPATCVKVAREELFAAMDLLSNHNTGDAAAAREHVRSAIHWLPSWLTDAWDERMAAWIERANAE